MPTLGSIGSRSQSNQSAHVGWHRITIKIRSKCPPRWVASDQDQNPIKVPTLGSIGSRSASDQSAHVGWHRSMLRTQYKQKTNPTEAGNFEGTLVPGQLSPRSPSFPKPAKERGLVLVGISVAVAVQFSRLRLLSSFFGGCHPVVSATIRGLDWQNVNHTGRNGKQDMQNGNCRQGFVSQAPTKSPHQQQKP